MRTPTASLIALPIAAAVGVICGALFDRHSDALIFDQRALWGMVLLTLVGLGGGWASLDRLIFNRLKPS